MQCICNMKGAILHMTLTCDFSAVTLVEERVVKEDGGNMTATQFCPDQ